MSSNPLWDGVREGCGTCEFAGPKSDYGQHECRRHPPVMLATQCSVDNNSTVDQYRPWMSPSDWCGEYKRAGATP